jgi:hypothetical protein
MKNWMKNRKTPANREEPRFTNLSKRQKEFHPVNAVDKTC